MDAQFSFRIQQLNKYLIFNLLTALIRMKDMGYFILFYLILAKLVIGKLSFFIWNISYR